jgi:hypothetical protein
MRFGLPGPLSGPMRVPSLRDGVRGYLVLRRRELDSILMPAPPIHLLRLQSARNADSL